MFSAKIFEKAKQFAIKRQLLIVSVSFCITIWSIDSFNTYMAYIFVKWCFGSIKTSVNWSRPILTSLTVARYSKNPACAISSLDWVGVLATVNFELITMSRLYLQVNWSCGLLFKDISSNSVTSLRLRRDCVVFR